MRGHIHKNGKWILFGIVLLYLILRLPNLTYQPIFADEAIYIRWAQIAKAEESLRFISLQDGKTPLFMWLMAPFLMIFDDPLFAGRLLSVISGLFTLLGAFLIGKRFFSQNIGLAGALLIAATPFMIFFDRMALVDSMLAAFTIWIIYWGLKLAHEKSWKAAIILGVLIGGAWLTKTPGMVNIVLLPLLLIFFDFKKAKLPSRLIKFGSFFVLSVFIAGSMYASQKIDPNFGQLSARNSDYIHPFSRLIEYPVDPLIPHFLDTIKFALPLLGPLLLILPIIIWVIIKGKINKVAIVLLAWSLIPFIFELQFIKAYTARYILFSIPPLILVFAFFLSKIPKQLSLIIICLSVLWGIYFSFLLLTNLEKLPLAKPERHGYLEDWTAGYGLKEIANYLITESKKGVVVVGTEGSFGTLPDGMVIYLDRYFHQTDDQKIIVLGGPNLVTDTVRNFSYERETFFVANKSRYSIVQPGLTLIKEYPKIAGPDFPQDSMLFYKVNPVSDK